METHRKRVATERIRSGQIPDIFQRYDEFTDGLAVGCKRKGS